MLLFLLGLLAGASVGFVIFAVVSVAAKEMPTVPPQVKVPLVLVK